METGALYWDHSYNAMVMLNLAVAVVLFTLLRFFSGTIAHIDASKELLKKDNPAFGISLAGVTFAVTILLSGLVYGTPGDNALQAASQMALYGAIGIVLMAVARIVFDKVALPHISLRDEIVKGNIAVAIADTSNVLAAAIIIRSLMLWVSDNSREGITALLAAYVLSQAILTLVTWLRLKLFTALRKGRSIEQELLTGNVALALAFGGQKIGIAFAISIAAGQVAYEAYSVQALLLPWLMASLIAIVALELFCFVAEKIILFRVDSFHEVMEQRNIAIGALQGIVYLSIAMLVAGM